MNILANISTFFKDSKDSKDSKDFKASKASKASKIFKLFSIQFQYDSNRIPIKVDC